MTQHTPGPWVYGRDGFIPGTFWVGRDYGKIICRVIGDEADANAKLIAAAPDLLDMLVRADAWISTQPDSRAMCEVIRAVVNKALNQ